MLNIFLNLVNYSCDGDAFSLNETVRNLMFF